MGIVGGRNIQLHADSSSESLSFVKYQESSISLSDNNSDGGIELLLSANTCVCFRPKAINN